LHVHLGSINDLNLNLNLNLRTQTRKMSDVEKALGCLPKEQIVMLEEL